ncbi:MAG: hypothetical protein II956_08295 [Bacteroidales bacterium]|nr:hypothetical protein [Bacteroidales bacterium]
MKGLGFLIAAVAVILLSVFCVKQTKPTLTEDKFLERDTYLNKRIDSLKKMVVYLAKNQDTIKRDLDTLKSGQKIIFDEVKKQTNKDFWSLF